MFFFPQVQELQKILEENENQKEISKQSILQQQEEISNLQNVMKQMQDRSTVTDVNHLQTVSSMNLSFLLEKRYLCSAIVTFKNNNKKQQEEEIALRLNKIYFVLFYFHLKFLFLSFMLCSHLGE